MDDSTVRTAKRFSDAGSAKKWTDMYSSETERLDEANFRRRRDVTVGYLLKVLEPDGRVLDLGCGAAPVVSALRQRGIACTGLEHSEDMLRHARERLRGMGLDTGDLHQGDCRQTPFEDHAFDAVVCLGVLSYAENYGAMLAEIHRVLKPGGVAIVSFRNRFNLILSDPIRAAKTAIKALFGQLEVEPYVIGRFMDHRDVQAQMRAHGFRYLDFFGIGFGPFKLNTRDLFTERTSMRISSGLTRLLGRVGWSAPFKWMADVSLWVYQKDVQTIVEPSGAR